VSLRFQNATITARELALLRKVAAGAVLSLSNASFEVFADLVAAGFVAYSESTGVATCTALGRRLLAAAR